MIENPLDRLNYYNGQRLEASDLKLEQEYHIRTRRWINKSLYTPGIARGLDIRPETDAAGKNTRFVIISPGLALDAEGREILLLEEERICVPGKPHSNTRGSDAKVEGLYLTIRYNEKAIEEERNGCIPKGANGKKSGDRAAWGGPALVRAKPLFNWSDALPYVTSGEIVLGEVELDAGCNYVLQINTGVRRYVGAASSSKVRQYALEGERHIDKDNPGKIYFHVRGRQPDAVTLYLRADKFSTLYYTELGNHAHALSDVAGTIGGPTDIASTTPSTYTSGEVTSPTDATQHTHNDLQASFFGDDGRSRNCFLVLGMWPTVVSGLANELPFVGTVGQGNLLPKISSGTWTDTDMRTHSQPPFPAVIQGATQHIHGHDHTHSFTFDSNLSGVKPAGIWSDPGSPLPVSQSYSGRGSSPLAYVDGLKVKIDGRPVTAEIVAQLKDADANWSANSQDKLGNGSVNHPLVMDPITRKGGTGEIKLDFLPNIYFLDGEHSIELSVEGDGNGGRILYNLYVE